MVPLYRIVRREERGSEGEAASGCQQARRENRNGDPLFIQPVFSGIF
jgi:hypothetical protein